MGDRLSAFVLFPPAALIKGAGVSCSTLQVLVFCEQCGAFGVHRCRLFAKPCLNRCTASSDRARKRLRLGLVPAHGMQWPHTRISGHVQPGQAHTEYQQPQRGLSCFDDADDWDPYADQV